MEKSLIGYFFAALVIGAICFCLAVIIMLARAKGAVL